ncbi:hypothetical protein ACQ4PT_051680 [Festuca glaucescens]
MTDMLHGGARGSSPVAWKGLMGIQNAMERIVVARMKDGEDRAQRGLLGKGNGVVRTVQEGVGFFCEDVIVSVRPSCSFLNPPKAPSFLLLLVAAAQSRSSPIQASSATARVVTVVMAESVQEQGLSAGMSELPSKEHGEAVRSGRVKHAVTRFRRGVRPKASGRYGAQIWVPSRRGHVWLGTFDTAEDAAKAYDAAAVELQAAGQAVKKTAPRPDAWTEFRGVYRTRSGRYAAQISHSKEKSWLGTFNAAEDAARAYDAAAVKLHGARAITNFRQPSQDKETTLETMAVKKEEESMDLLNDFLEVPALDFLLHSLPSGAKRDDLWADLLPVERQLVDGFLKDTDVSDMVP